MVSWWLVIETGAGSHMVGRIAEVLLFTPATKYSQFLWGCEPRWRPLACSIKQTPYTELENKEEKINHKYPLLCCKHTLSHRGLWASGPTSIGFSKTKPGACCLCGVVLHFITIKSHRPASQLQLCSLLTACSWENDLISFCLRSMTYSVGFIINKMMHIEQQAPCSLPICVFQPQSWPWPRQAVKEAPQGMLKVPLVCLLSRHSLAVPVVKEKIWKKCLK